MELTEVTKFRRAVLTGLARFTWQGTLPEHIYDIRCNRRQSSCSLLCA